MVEFEGNISLFPSNVTGSIAYLEVEKKGLKEDYAPSSLLSSLFYCSFRSSSGEGTS